MLEKTRKIATLEHLDHNKTPPKYKIRYYSISFGFVIILSIGTSIVFFINYKQFIRNQTIALKQFRKYQKLGLPRTQIVKQYNQLKTLQNKSFGPIPIKWLGTSKQIASIQNQAKSSYNAYSSKQKKLAIAAGDHLINLQTGWNGASTPSKINKEVKAAQSLKARKALVTKWNTEANSWQQQLTQLSQVSGGLTKNQPSDIINAVNTLSTRLNNTPSNWRGLPEAKDALADTQSYLTLPLAEQISRHEEIIQELQSSLAGVKPPSLNPFGSSFINYIKTRQGIVSTEAFNYKTGTTYSYQSGINFDSASIIKVTIMATLLWQSQNSGQALPVSEQQLMVPMIEDSSNSAATALWNDAGGSLGIQKFLNAAGMNNTIPGKGGFWGLSQVNANDEMTLLKILSSPNSILSSNSQIFASHLMQNVIPWERWGVSNGPTPGTSVSLKNGWLPIGNQGWIINSIGIVSGNGNKYCVVLLSKESPSQSYGIQTLNTISKMIWNKS